MASDETADEVERLRLIEQGSGLECQECGWNGKRGADESCAFCEVGRLRDDNKRLLDDACGAAALRQAFNVAVKNYPTQHPMSPAVQAWWEQFYNAIVSSSSGMGVLAEIQLLKDKVRELEEERDRRELL